MRPNPLVNRAVSAFPPGSTFKLVTALAGLRKGLAAKHVSTAAAASDTAIITSNAGSPRKAAATAALGLSDAIKVSCNSFFYQFGNAAGIEAIDEIGEIARPGQNVRY